MIAGHLANRARGDQVQARIAHVSDGDLFAFHQGQREDAGHAGQFRVLARLREDSIVGRGNGVAYQCRGRHVRAPGYRIADRRHGDLRRALTRRLAANSIHDQECTARRIHPVAILIVIAHQAGIGRGSAGQR